MIIIGCDMSFIVDLKKHLQREFDVKDLGSLSYFLSFVVVCSSRGYLVSQQKYTSDLLTRACLTDDRTADTLIELNQKLRPTDDTIAKSYSILLACWCIGLFDRFSA